MKFRSRKDITFKLITAGYSFLFAVLLGESFFYKNFNHDYFVVFDIIISVLWILVLWSFFDTSYKVKKGYLICRSGIRLRKVKINNITKILVGKTLWSGKRLATARKGLVIIYGENQQIYISPKTNESFVKHMVELKPDVEIEFYEDHWLK